MSSSPAETLEKVSGSLSCPLLNGSISLQLTAEEAVSDVVGSINRDSQSLSSLSRSSGQFRREYLSRTIFIGIHTKRGAHTATAHRDMGPNEHKPSMVRRRLDPHPCILSTRLREMGPVSMGHSSNSVGNLNIKHWPSPRF
jgi:hypothetical protein